MQSKVIPFYLLMLLGYIAHVFEEIWGRFWLLNKMGLGWYLTGNGLLFCVPVVLFYFILNRRRWAYLFSLVYAGFMGLQGLGHAAATLMTGKYFDGFAGGYSGIGLLVISLPMILFLWKEMPQD
jgi:hypothetical protein